jgi:hypothetical protein
MSDAQNRVWPVKLEQLNGYGLPDGAGRIRVLLRKSLAKWLTPTSAGTRWSRPCST